MPPLSLGFPLIVKANDGRGAEDVSDNGDVKLNIVDVGPVDDIWFVCNVMFESIIAFQNNEDALGLLLQLHHFLSGFVQKTGIIF